MLQLQAAGKTKQNTSVHPQFHPAMGLKKYKPLDLHSDQSPKLFDKQLKNLQEEKNKKIQKLNEVWWRGCLVCSLVSFSLLELLLALIYNMITCQSTRLSSFENPGPQGPLACMF